MVCVQSKTRLADSLVHILMLNSIPGDRIHEVEPSGNTRKGAICKGQVGLCCYQGFNIHFRWLWSTGWPGGTTGKTISYICGRRGVWGLDTADATLKVNCSIHLTGAIVGALPFMTYNASKQFVSPGKPRPRIWNHSTLVKNQIMLVSQGWLEVNLIPMIKSGWIVKVSRQKRSSGTMYSGRIIQTNYRDHKTNIFIFVKRSRYPV